uniref:Uncharacterized protein n=1 Tax=Knipowitschia caucasica TaxID=637954 RepID=A0AAV2KAH7_KNICA
MCRCFGAQLWGGVLGRSSRTASDPDGTRIDWTLKTHLQSCTHNKGHTLDRQSGASGACTWGWEVGGPWVLQQV